MRGKSIQPPSIGLAAWLLGLSLVTVLSCGREGQQRDEAGSASAPDSVLGQCVQLEVTIGDGFEIDGQPVSRGELAEKLLGAYEARNREVAVDVRCEEGVKVAALRELHDAMLAHGLHRIQYFGHSGEPVPYVLPAPQMTDRLADLPAEAISRLRVGPDGLNLDGRDVTREALGPAVHARLAENPSVVVIVESEADVAYADFVAVLGEVTAAGAERLAIEIPSGVEG